MRYGLWSELVRKVCDRSWTPAGEMMGVVGVRFVLVIFDTNNCRYVMICWFGDGFCQTCTQNITSIHHQCGECTTCEFN